MIMIRARDFNLRHTVHSGQPLTFYSSYSKLASVENLSYVTDKGQIRLSRSAKGVAYSFHGNYDEKSARQEVISRFDLKFDMQKMYKAINTDRFMASSIKQFNGMRITRNDPWEATVCFVISQFNNLKRIRGIIHNLITEFGEDAGGYNLFPTPEALASADIAALRACGTGFRDKYLKSVAQQFAYSFDKSRLYKMSYENAKEQLMELDGIGDKVADCILLFGYHKLEAFPIDTWVKRIMEEVYFDEKKMSIKKIHEFAELRWPKEYLGYAQQYIFWGARENSK